MELLQFMEQTQCFVRSRFIYIITSFLVSGNLVSPRQQLCYRILFSFQCIFVHFISIFWYFQAGKKQKRALQIPRTVSDVPRLALLHP